MNDIITMINLIENALDSSLPSESCLEAELIKSMKYSLKAGGKRVRPLLTLMFADACGGTVENALPFACAVEMIHTYSLIHDDLPCMDNDDYRRGRPSNHKVFGEDIALLAGDALLTLAFETALSQEDENNTSAKAALALARYAGAKGMVGGQTIDLTYENKNASVDILKEMDVKKTSALIMAACEMGCISAGADDRKISAARSFGENIGLAFQIIDDILDVTSTSSELGKPVGSDAENNKSTYVSLLGLEKCKEIANELTVKAVKSLDEFDSDTSQIKEFALSLLDRKN
ncbi:MAG: polyprenyl synthetase family protein [Acutalibacteraceae bacterium]